MPLDHKHGDVLPDSRIFWVGADGIGRPVTQDLFATLEEQTRRNVFRAKNAVNLFSEENVVFTESLRFYIQQLSSEELAEIFSVSGEARDTKKIEAFSRINREFGLE